MIDDLMTAPELARLLRINKASIYRWSREGCFPALRIGRRWRYSKSEVIAWIRRPHLATPADTSPERQAAA